MGGPGSGSKGGPGTGRPVGCSQPCGTKTKYNYHINRKENCQICKDAINAIARANYVPKIKAQKQSPAVRKRNRRDWLVDQKMSRVACMDCGLKVEAHITYVFDYDHRDPHLKSFAISEYLHQYTEYRLLQEMDKCDLVCAICHRHRTHHQQQTGILTGYKKDRQQPSNCHDVVLTLFDLSNI